MSLNRTLTRTFNSNGLSFPGCTSILRIFEEHEEQGCRFDRASKAIRQAIQDGAIFMFDCSQNLYHQIIGEQRSFAVRSAVPTNWLP